jgi:hypothetical protein
MMEAEGDVSQMRTCPGALSLTTSNHSLCIALLTTCAALSTLNCSSTCSTPLVDRVSNILMDENGFDAVKSLLDIELFDDVSGSEQRMALSALLFFLSPMGTSVARR